LKRVGNTGVQIRKLIQAGLVMILVGLGNAAVTPALAEALAPVGFRLLCLQQPAECKGGGAKALVYSDGLMQTLTRVNAQVNAQIRPMADRNGDVWSINVSAGDCEDYVMTKRHALIGAGLAASALRIGWVETRQGEKHAVLVVETTKHGDLVLDNLTGSIRSLAQTGYRVLAMSGPDPRVWS